MASAAQAALNISVISISGGNTVDFGRVRTGAVISKEVRMRVTSTDGKPYQVFQSFSEPPVNEKGVRLRSNAIEAYTLSGSNSFGTRYLDQKESLGYGNQLVYSSDTVGDSDAFTIVYAVDGNTIGSSGKFFGKVVYTVRSSDGSQERGYLNLSLESFNDFQNSVKGSTTIDSVEMVVNEKESKDGYVKIQFTDNPGSEVKVYQEFIELPQNESFEEIGLSVVEVTSEATNHSEIRIGSELTRVKELIYLSTETNDDIVVKFHYNEIKVAQQKAGRYLGKIRYSIETDSKIDIFDINFVAIIDPIFRMEVELPAGGLSFRNLIPNNPPIEHELTVNVHTNIGKPYMIIQNIGSLLTNEKGSVIPAKYFTMKLSSDGETKGELAFINYRPVVISDSPIFYSDKFGSSTMFKVLYKLAPFAEIDPGDYTTSIRYSFGEK